MNYYDEEYCIDPIFDLSLEAQDRIENTDWPYPTRLIQEDIDDTLYVDESLFFY